MNSILKANFSIDKANNSITVKRDFNAPVGDVWAAWTQSELLDQWWAPRPYKAVTKSIDFTAGGHWRYAMEGPEGDRSWIFVEILSVEEKKNFSARTDFSDEHGKITKEYPGMHWDVNFSGNGDTTSVTAGFQFDSTEDLEAIIQMGFKEGFSMGLDQLDELLA